MPKPNAKRQERQQKKQTLKEEADRAIRDALPVFPLGHRRAVSGSTGSSCDCCKCAFCTDPDSENLCEPGDSSCAACSKVRRILETAQVASAEDHGQIMEALALENTRVQLDLQTTANALVDAVHAVAELNQGILEARRYELEQLHKKQRTEALKARVEKLRAEIDERRKKQAELKARLAAAKEDDRKDNFAPVNPGLGYTVTFVHADKKGKRKK